MDFLTDLRHMFYITNPEETQFEDDEEITIVKHAIPFFGLFLIVEFIVAYFRGNLSSFDYKDIIASTSSGTMQQLVLLISAETLSQPYFFIYNNFRLFTFDSTTWTHFILLMLGTDLGYYWMHRNAHSWHWMWTGHSVHHSGQHYNVATAMRQGILQQFYSWPTYLPLAFIGFNPLQFMVHSQLNLIYQYWVHSEQIGYLGPLELIFNTPSHHRMHHRPPGNCNYAGVLIIWDRMFGTFRGEDKQIKSYGLAKPLQSYNGVWHNLQHWTRMMKINDHDNSNTISAWFNKIFARRVNHPMIINPLKMFQFEAKHKESLWKLDDGSSEAHRVELFHGAKLNLAMTLHTFINFIISFLGSYTLMVIHKDIPKYQLSIVMLFFIWSLASVGQLLSELNRVAILTESLRIYALQSFLMMPDKVLNFMFESNNVLRETVENFIPDQDIRLGGCIVLGGLWVVAFMTSKNFSSEVNVNNSGKIKAQ